MSIERKANEVVEKVDTAIDYVKNGDAIDKAKEIVSTAKDKIEDFDLSEFIQDTFNIDKKETEKVDTLVNNNSYNGVLNNYKNNATIDVEELSKNRLKIDNLDDIANTDNDKNYLIKKTTLDMYGNDMEYSSKKTSAGTTTYYDSDGNKIKIIKADGTVSFGGKTIKKDGYVIDAVGRDVLTDGSSYWDDNIIKSDGSSYLYNKNNKLISYTDKNGNVTRYSYDEDGNIKNIEVYKKELNADGTKRTIVYDNDGSYTVTDTSQDTDASEVVKYDKDGNYISRSSITEDKANGRTIELVDGKKNVYKGDQLEYVETNDGITTTRTYYNNDGTVNKEETIENGNVTQTIDKYSNGDYKITDASGEEIEYYSNGTPKGIELNGNKTYYYENGQTKSQINANGTEVSYNEDGSKIYEKFSDGTTQYYNSDGSVDYYDENMNLIKEVKADGSEVYWN